MSLWDGIFGRRRSKLSGRPDPGGTVSVTLSGGVSDAGKAVTPDSAMQLSAAWSCIRLLSETIGTLPLFLYERSGSDRQIARDNPLYEVLHDSPNADQTAAEFWEGMVACLCLVGNGYARKDMLGNRLVGLTPLKPDRMVVKRDAAGRRKYHYSGEGTLEILDEVEVFHLRGFGVGGDCGLSPISYARQSMGAAMAAEEAAAKVFGSGLQLSGFIDSGQQKLTQDQRNQIAALFNQFMGSSNAGKLMVLEAGMKFLPLGMNPEDAQLLTTRSFQVEEICRWFRVPPFMIGHTEKTTSWGTGLEQQMIGFLTFSLRPYLTRIEQAVRKQLLAPADRSGFFAEFLLDGLLRADSTGRAALYNAFAQNGIMDRDEIRSKENLPKRGGNAAELTVQSNLVPLDKLGAADATSSATQQVRSGLMNLLFGGDLERIIDERVKARLGHNGGPALED